MRTGLPVGMVALDEALGAEFELGVAHQAVETFGFEFEALLDRAAETAHSCLEVGPEGGLRQRRDLPGPFEGIVDAGAARDDPVDQADPRGLVGADHAAGDDQVECRPETDQSRQALGAAVAEPDVPPAAGDPERGVPVGDPEVGEAGPLETAGVGGAVHRGDHRLVDVGPAGRADVALGRDRMVVQSVRKIEERFFRRVLLVHRGDRLEVRSGTEGVGAGTGDDQDPGRVVITEPRHRFEQAA